MSLFARHHGIARWPILALALLLAPVIACAGDAKVADDKPEAAKTEPAKSDTAKSDTAKSDTAKPDAAKTDDAKSDTAKTEKDKPEADPFAVPDGTPAELLEFMAKVRRVEPKATSQAELRAHYVKVYKAVLAAADKILAGKPEDKAQFSAIQAKFEALTVLGQIGDEPTAKQLQEFATSLKDDPKPEIQRLAKRELLMARIGSLSKADAAESAKIWDEVKGMLVANPDDTGNLQLAMSVAGHFEHNPKTLDLAVQADRDLIAILGKSKNPKFAALAVKLEGVVRRVGLMGHPIEIKGTLVDGKPFDQSTLKGKVVLVDYWATWCGPCRAELPNVKRNYAKYHDKGFEVVGISLDNDKDALTEFLAKEKITWPILFGEDEATRGWEHPMASYYGIMGIPTVILTNQKGEVVSLNARGEELTNKLEELLGKPEEK